MSVSHPKLFPQSECKEKVDSKEAFANRIDIDNLIEYDVIVRMPPKKRYFLEIDISGIIKAKPKVLSDTNCP